METRARHRMAATSGGCLGTAPRRDPKYPSRSPYTRCCLDHYAAGRKKGGKNMRATPIYDRLATNLPQLLHIWWLAPFIFQASAIAGVGIIVEHGGKNTYRGVRRVQGQALGGVGILIGRGGQNDYHAAMWAQGFGAPLGFGLLEDTVGHDHYYCGGLYITSYKHPTNSRIPATPGYEGFGQGVGAGIRQVGDGGIGIILNGGGHNVYEFDYLSHGGGYWCGMGFARDFGGNSQRLIARTAWNGSRAYRATLSTIWLRLGMSLFGGFLVRRWRQQPL